MRKVVLVVLAVAIVAPVWAQEEYTPVSPQDAGLIPKTDTIDLNAWGPAPEDPRNNGNTESLGVAIGSGGNSVL